MNILLTAGATREPIDSVRFLSNISSGATGATLAERLAAAGHRVTLLHGESAVRPGAMSGVSCVVFGSTEQLGERLRAALGTGDFDVVIHAAAVSDYRPATVSEAKLSSDAASMTIQLVPTPKLLPQLRGWSPRPVRVIGFKLTTGAGAAGRTAAVGKLLERGGVDVVVQNDTAELSDAGAGRTFRLYRCGADDAAADVVRGVPALGEWLVRWVNASRG
jgi:phosphopantothenoylcysteine decarboxylase/phosphopantothenate--cysteine ligase